MTPSLEQALLPEGLQDTLPPDAQREAAMARNLLDSFASYGYERVSPPLIEFEDSFVGGAVKQRSPAMVRAVDPISQRMMAIRSDFTPQVARIATTRLAAEPRPLRLCYAGPVVRARGSQLRPEREFTQVGCEIFGSADVAAEVEVVTLAASALHKLGITEMTIDLVTPTLVPTICEALGLSSADRTTAREALQAKDVGALKHIGGEAGALFKALLDLAGPAEDAVAALEALSLPGAVAPLCRNLSELVHLLNAALPDVALTVDPGEYLSFEYHTGIAFSVFARNVRGELGRGGRYLAGNGSGEDAARAEPAVGFTAFLDSLMRALPGTAPAHKAYLPKGEDMAAADSLRAEGWQVVAALAGEENPTEAARAIGCSHIIRDGKARPLSE